MANRNYLIVALGGKAQAGKTTAAKYIKHYVEGYYGGKYKVEITPFAKTLKDLCTDLFDWDGDKGVYYNDDGSIVKDKGRQLLITVAAALRGVRATVFADALVKHILDRVYNLGEDNIIYIIDDMRYKNEVALLEKLNGRVMKIKVVNNRVKEIDDPSEKDLDGYSDWDLRFENHGPMFEYEKLIDNNMHFIMGRLEDGE